MDKQDAVQDSGKGNPSSLSRHPLSPLQLFCVWMGIGVQSFGGGSATLYLIRRTAVERHGWLTDDDFSRYWGICQIAPGINILGLVILIGWRVAGAMGAVVSLSGLLVPSVAITVALTSIYSHIREAPLTRSAIAGVVPATVGLGLLLSFAMLLPLLRSAWHDGRASAFIAVTLLLGSAILAALTSTPALAILWGAGAVSGLMQWQLMSRQRPPK
jgi:chromate transporter